MTLADESTVIRLTVRGVVRTVRPMSNATDHTYPAAIKADDAYSAELRRVFGNAAGEARYDARGTSTPELRRLCDAKLAADASRVASSTASSTKLDHAEALDSIAFRAHEALKPKTTSAGREVYAVKDLVAALNDILAVTRAAGVE